MVMEQALVVSHDTWSSVHLDTAVKLPDCVAWDLSARTNSWINILWLGEVQMASDLNVDPDYSQLAPVRFRSIPDSSQRDLQRGCCWIGKMFKSDDDKWRPVVHFNCDSKLVGLGAVQQREPDVEASFWVNDDRYSGKLERVLRKQVQEWLGATKVVYVYECDSAGAFLEDCEDGNYHLAACSAGEKLPDRDLFSKLLSVPVQTAYEWHCGQTNRKASVRSVPGDVTDRQMLLGQLDWVLTLITDAIAKDSLPREQFYELFRKDLLTGTHFRRFLLSQRVLKSNGCNAVSKPALPDCSHHRLWAIWDHLMDMTAMLLSVQSERKCPIVDTFFRILLDDHYQDHPNLLLPALTQSMECSKALKALTVCWTKVAEDRKLQECILNQTVLLLHWKDDGIRKDAIECLAKIIANESELAQFMISDVDINLCVSLDAETNPGLIAQTLFLQLLFESNSTAGGNPTHKQSLGAVCSELMSHPEAKVRTWSVLLAATLSDEDIPGLRKRFQDLWSDPAPKVRAAALESWISTHKRQSDHQDICLARLLSMVSSGSSSFVRREVTDALIAVIVANRMKELIAISKQEATCAKQQPEPPKSKGKAKAKQQPKKGPQTTKSDAELGRVWRIMVALQTDPDQAVAASMRSLVTFVRGRVAELESNDKKKKKKAAANCNEPEFALPTRKPLYDRIRRDLLDETEVIVKDELPKEGGARLLNGLSVPRNPTLALLNHQLKSFHAQQVPEMVRFGSDRQLVTVCKDDVTWRNYTTEYKAHLKAPSKVTSLLMDTPQVRSTLLVGYHDGSVRMWQSHWEADPTLLTAWQALYDLENASSNKVHGISMTMLGRGQLITGGDARYLRKWDLEKEFTLGDVGIGTDQAVTGLTSNGSCNVVAGLENGTVRLFDLRAEADGRVAVGPKHGNPVRAVSLRPDDVSMVSACSGGSVHLVDLRKMIPAVKKWSVAAVPVDVAVHERLDVVAVAGENSLEVYSIEGERICGGEGEGVVCVGFHPSEALLGAGYRRDGGTVVLYGDEGAF